MYYLLLEKLCNFMFHFCSNQRVKTIITPCDILRSRDNSYSNMHLLCTSTDRHILYTNEAECIHNLPEDKTKYLVMFFYFTFRYDMST